MFITGTHFNYYLVCHRKLWLFSSGITMEHTSDLVYEGKLIHENSYPQRSLRYEELELDGIKIDYYDAKNKVVHEIKKSDKIAPAHRLQLLYYLYVLEQNGVVGATGILEYPKLRRREEVLLTDMDREQIQEIGEEIERIIESKECPPVISSKICKNCSYYDFCFSGKESEQL
ncbi:CRISPR-associated protein Cas4 [Porphyromonas sp. COT-108 OH1349]|uniref:CRISPR-associated protein Cas4 n=1 Tax=Porphyromonas sp. COT-108 OH1349 TaxID=1537504 RepID=UPI00052E0F2F|nr:CRISPR-associated protein Cas4 [Porphyromonas sp. COT-108 OH1349]KGN69283.1 CRISPR-associated protein Cas4 [Porphyromonas sp. COT-108 OH1349]